MTFQAVLAVSCRYTTSLIIWNAVLVHFMSMYSNNWEKTWNIYYTIRKYVIITFFWKQGCIQLSKSDSKDIML